MNYICLSCINIITQEFKMSMVDFNIYCVFGSFFVLIREAV